MITILMILLVLVAILMMGAVLIQSSKGGGLAGTFGGGDASAVFGVRRTADFLIKLTSILGTILLLFSLVTNVIINKGGGTNESIIQQNTGQQNPQPNVPNQMQQDQQQQQQQVDPNQQQQQQQQVDPNQQQRNQQPPK
jgi:preprotein translocase subunit SecG